VANTILSPLCSPCRAAPCCVKVTLAVSDSTLIWLKFDPEKLTLSGTAPPQEIGKTYYLTFRTQASNSLESFLQIVLIHFIINELQHFTVRFRHFEQEKYFGYVHIARLCLLGSFFPHSPLTFFAGPRFRSLI